MTGVRQKQRVCQSLVPHCFPGNPLTLVRKLLCYRFATKLSLLVSGKKEVFQGKSPSTHQKRRSSKALWGLGLRSEGFPAEMQQRGLSQIPGSAHNSAIACLFIPFDFPQVCLLYQGFCTVCRVGSVTVSLYLWWHWNPEKGRESHHVRSPAVPAGGAGGRDECWMRATHVNTVRVATWHGPADTGWQANQKGTL